MINGYQKGNMDKTMLGLDIAGLAAGGIGLAGGAADTASADGAAIGFADSPTAAADVSSSVGGGAGGWLNLVKKATGVLAPITNLTSGADNNNYQAPVNSFSTQNYNQ
jgi:hypothetical protein